MKTREQVIAELDAKIPSDFVTTREQSGVRLEYLEAWYVIHRLNKVLGQGNWAYTSDVFKLTEEVVNGKPVVNYSAKVRLAVTIEGISTEFTDYGFGEGINKVAGRAHELAIKGAITDGIKRCAKNLGMSMGLALYDKEKEFVDYGDNQEDKKEERVSADSRVGSREFNANGNSNPTSRDGDALQPAPEANKGQEDKTRDDIIKTIRSTFRVATDMKKVTREDFLYKLKNDYKVEKVDSLPYNYAREVLTYLEGLVNA